MSFLSGKSKVVQSDWAYKLIYTQKVYYLQKYLILNSLHKKYYHKGICVIFKVQNVYSIHTQKSYFLII